MLAAFAPSGSLKANLRPDVKVAHLDTYHEVNGVAMTLQQQVRLALKTNKDLTVITCHAEKRSNDKGLQNFAPIGVYELPEYPEQKLYYPPFLEMLSYCYEQDFTHIHTATPGPIGLAALAISRILKLPISGTYHTALPQYARYLTEDGGIEELVWKYTLWYYNQLNFIYVPSRSTGQELVGKGIRAKKYSFSHGAWTSSVFIPASATQLSLKSVGKFAEASNCSTWGGFPRKRTWPCWGRYFEHSANGL